MVCYVKECGINKQYKPHQLNVFFQAIILELDIGNLTCCFLWNLFFFFFISKILSTSAGFIWLTWTRCLHILGYLVISRWPILCYISKDLLLFSRHTLPSLKLKSTKLKRKGEAPDFRIQGATNISLILLLGNWGKKTLDPGLFSDFMLSYYFWHFNNSPPLRQTYSSYVET